MNIVALHDKRYIAFIAKAFFKLGLSKETVFFAAPRIKENSQDPVLMYYQAKALLKLKLNNYALILAKYACELAPESTSVWVLLANAYVAAGNYKNVTLSTTHTITLGFAGNRYCACIFKRNCE